MIYKTKYNSPLGVLSIASDGKSLTGLWFEGQKYFEATLHSEPKTDDSLEVFKSAKDWLNRYFKGENPQISELSMAPEGSEFRQKVWEILCTIPYGSTMTYKEIANKFGANMSPQAIGGAVGHNPISIIIPCHRVIGTNGSLTGYAGGIERKIKLLELENCLVT